MDSSLDDLASFGSDGILSSEDKKLHNHNLAIPSSPTRRPASPLYNPTGLTIGQLSPGIRSFSSDKSSHVRSESNFLVNAVHMHVQENAKIPNYNKAVDRSIPQHHSLQHPPSATATATATAATDSRHSHEHHNQFLQDFSMAELFLNKESNNRKSLNQNYENLGSISASSTGAATTANARGGTTEEAAALEIDALTAAIDPTPWSEIEDKIHKEERIINAAAALERKNQHQHHHNMMNSPSATANHPHQSSYYPYGRHHQLPIPERIHSPPQQKQVLPVSNGHPTSAISGVHKDGMADAVATAAAIVASSATVPAPVHTNAQSIDKRRFPPTSIAANPSVKTAAPAQTHPPQPDSSKNASVTATASHVAATKNSLIASRTSTSLPPRHLQRQRANSVAPPTHAAAHSTSRASVLAAASRKSQYGFGGNHTVPSVPAPPPTHGPRPKVVSTTRAVPPRPKNGTILAAPKTTNIKARIYSKSPSAVNSQGKKPLGAGATFQGNLYPTKQSPQPIPNLPPSIQNGNPHGNSGAAYERKKQRAKDARVKLNESIDRLSIAISVAGSQASERINQLQDSVVVTDCRQRTLESNQKCLTLAEQAKKWDRPSFVGTAASLIQSLNGQCEALMAELVALQQGQVNGGEQPAQSTGLGSNSAPAQFAAETPDGITAVDGSTETLPFDPYHAGAVGFSPISGQPQGARDIRVSVKEENKAPTSPPDHKRSEQPANAERNEPASKRARLDAGTSAGSAEPLSDEAIIFDSVAKLLDPVSLCRSVRVSKLWRSIQGFTDEDVWLKLMVKRFGFYNVRQWSEKYEDGETGGEKRISNKILYREMNAANVMPHITNQDGTLSLLGEATIPGRVSGWVFLVERSNGETLRSVKQQPGPNGTSRAYQSRPVVELRMVVQNTGMANRPMILKKQAVTVDVSTRRSGGELVEIEWDSRFLKTVKNIDGTSWKPKAGNGTVNNGETHGELCCLDLFDTVVLELHILATGCSTTSKFRQRSNFTKLLVSLDGTTVPMVIPFLRDHNSNLH